MKVKDLIEELESYDPEAVVVRLDKFEHSEINTVSEVFLVERHEGWCICKPSEPGSFSAVHFGE